MGILTKYINLLFTLFVIVSISSGCASRTSAISPTYVSPIKYKGYSCEQIENEMVEISGEAQRVTDNHNLAVAKDTAAMTVGLVVFWPSLFLLVGGDKEEEISLLKGEHDALVLSAMQNQCVSLLENLEEERKKRNEEHLAAQKKDMEFN